MFKIPKSDRYFWGGEFLTKDGRLSIDDAYHRLSVYARIHSLVINEGTISLDETLMGALHTNNGSLHWVDLPSLLAKL